ncbi:MAG TPA: hypothetical protein VF668_08040 [Pyrinomonadaceae bacterium]|jgi:hypothetical protein
MNRRALAWLLLFALAACTAGQSVPRERAAPAPSQEPAPRRAAAETFSAGHMYWATPQPVLCKDWYVVLGGAVVETHREAMPGLTKERHTAGTLRVERVFMSLPTKNEAAPGAGVAYFKSEAFDGLKRGDKVIVFVNEYDGGYGIVEAAGSNTKLGIKVRSWDDPIVRAVETLTRDPQAARFPEGRREVLKDPEQAKAWRPFAGKGAAGGGCLP